MFDHFAWIGTGGGTDAMVFQAVIYALAVGAVLLAAAALFGGWWLVAKFALHRKVKIIPSVIVSVVVSFVVLYGLFMLPSNIRGYRWQKILDDCSRAAGYESHMDDNNPNIATFESQQVFQKCIEERERDQGSLGRSR